METKLSWISNDIIRFDNSDLYARIDNWTDKDIKFIDVYVSTIDDYKNKQQNVLFSTALIKESEDVALRIIQAFVDGYCDGYSSGKEDGRKETVEKVKDAIYLIRLFS